MKESFQSKLRETIKTEMTELSKIKAPKPGDYVRIKTTHIVGVFVKYCEEEGKEGLILVEHHPKCSAQGSLVHEISEIELITKKEFDKEIEYFLNTMKREQ